MAAEEALRAHAQCACERLTSKVWRTAEPFLNAMQVNLQSSAPPGRGADRRRAVSASFTLVRRYSPASGHPRTDTGCHRASLAILADHDPGGGSGTRAEVFLLLGWNPAARRSTYESPNACLAASALCVRQRRRRFFTVGSPPR